MASTCGDMKFVPSQSNRPLVLAAARNTLTFLVFDRSRQPRLATLSGVTSLAAASSAHPLREARLAPCGRVSREHAVPRSRDFRDLKQPSCHLPGWVNRSSFLE